MRLSSKTLVAIEASLLLTDPVLRSSGETLEQDACAIREANLLLTDPVLRHSGENLSFNASVFFNAIVTRYLFVVFVRPFFRPRSVVIIRT